MAKVQLRQDDNFLNHIPLMNGVDNVEAIEYPAKAGMVPVEVSRIVSAVADEELRASGVSPGMSH